MPYSKYDGSALTETAQAAVNFYGSNAVETMTGGSAAEGFWGSTGDSLVGGAGDDTYYFQGAGVRVTEAAGGGIDKIVAWSNVNLANIANVENLEVGGDKTYAAGNGLNNLIIANGTNQELYGGGGQDVLVGSSAGADTFVVVKGEGNDAIYNFNPAQDLLRLASSGYGSFAQVQAHMTQVGADVKIDLGGTDALVIRNLSTNQLTTANFQLQLDPAKLGALSFRDEFSSQLSLWDRESNPTGLWRPDYGYAGPQGTSSYTLPTNGELQIYTSPYFREHNGDFAETPFVSNSDGTLSIIAKTSSNNEIFGYDYTSGMITSRETFAQTYGYFEMRADLPSAAGAWPAFWLLPADGSWPPELDVMETLSHDPNADYTTAHSNFGGNHTMNQGISFIPETTDGFHTYGVLWTASDLTWFVDGVEVHHAPTPADMHKPMYMLANLALGGWGGAVTDAQLPAEMKIDYIRAFSLADGSSSIAYDTARTGGGTATSGVSGSTGGGAGSTGASGSTGGATTGGATSGGALALNASGPNSVLIGGVGGDTLNASDGYDTLTGGGGADVFVFGREPWAPNHITDFVVGQDRIDLTALFRASGYTGADPVGDRLIYLQSDGAGGTLIRFDRDGTGPTPVWPNTIIDLEHVSPAGLTWAKLSPDWIGG
jgi:beta-glucanase (GH16 family)